MLKLSIECTRFETNYSSCTGRSSEFICSSGGGAQRKWKRGWNSICHQNCWKPGKLDWVPVISFCKIFIPSCVFDALICRNWQFSPPNRGTLRITLIITLFSNFWSFLICKFKDHAHGHNLHPDWKKICKKQRVCSLPD